MFTTAVLLASKPKGKYLMVLMRSVLTGHARVAFRERLGDKKEMIALDPYVHMMALYKEEKKIKTVRKDLHFSYLMDRNLPQFTDDGELIENQSPKFRKIPKLE